MNTERAQPGYAITSNQPYWTYYSDPANYTTSTITYNAANVPL